MNHLPKDGENEYNQSEDYNQSIDGSQDDEYHDTGTIENFYRRLNVTNTGLGQAHFDQGLRLLLSYQHEEASHYFLACLKFAPDCALAHALVALSHSPNYNFKGVPYYQVSFPPPGEKTTGGGGGGGSDDHMTKDDTNSCTTASTTSPFQEEETKSSDSMIINPPAFPSQLFADYHSRRAVEKVEELRRRNVTVTCPQKRQHLGEEDKQHGANDNSNSNSTTENAINDELEQIDQSQEIKDVEVMLINAVRTLNQNPGVDPEKAEAINGHPYVNAMRALYKQYPEDAEVAYFFVESIMIIHAWNLFEYPTGKPLSDDVPEVKVALENALMLHPQHVGLCHMYVHLCEMATYPEKALNACDVLRQRFPEAGHLLHMPTHIDVLVGDYDSCVRWNDAAITADTKTMERSPQTAGVSSFYFGYIAHNYHMLIYGAILGAMEEKAMSIAQELNLFLHEELFVKKPQLAVYLESYSTMDIHVLVRFGRWNEILGLTLPNDKNLMLYRAACIHYAKAIAYANLGEMEYAKAEAARYEEIRSLPGTKNRILHNNSISDLLDVDSLMIKGEIAYFEGQYEDAFAHLRGAVKLQDGLNYDEPWGKMQPIRHALGGLLLKRGKVIEAEKVYCEDLRRLPNNPWSLRGLIDCMKFRLGMNKPTNCCCSNSESKVEQHSIMELSKEESAQIKNELSKVERQFLIQRMSEWADFDVTHSCACCVEESKF